MASDLTLLETVVLDHRCLNSAGQLLPHINLRVAANNSTNVRLKFPHPLVVYMGRHTDTGFKPTPAIVRDYDREIDGEHRIDRYCAALPGPILGQPKNTVSHNPGLGDSGYKIQTVEHDCPECSFERMVRRVDIRPEATDTVRYWCLNPNCVHFVRDHLSHACHGNYPQRDTDEPAVFEERSDY